MPVPAGISADNAALLREAGSELQQPLLRTLMLTNWRDQQMEAVDEWTRRRRSLVAMLWVSVVEPSFGCEIDVEREDVGYGLRADLLRIWCHFGSRPSKH